MKKWWLPIIAFVLIFSLAGCSSSESSDTAKSIEMDSAAGSESEAKQEMAADTAETVEDDQVVGKERMVIHRATLELNVKDLEKDRKEIEEKTAGYGGYIVESNVFRDDREMLSGMMVIRVPEKHFKRLLEDAEKRAEKVVGRNVSGEDVTEQYVDLESRLKSKKAVEERLLDFMKDAQKTEDLLKISADLAKVQEEIEVLTGKMKYLENQTAFSTVEIHMTETRVVVPGVDGQKLDTWEKTKKQLAVSLNFLLAAASGIVVFFVGNLPIFVLLGLMGAMVYGFARRKKKRRE